MPTIDVTRTYLEMRSAAELRPAPAPGPEVRIDKVETCPPSFFRYLYAEVGRQYHWHDRLQWSEEKIRGRLTGPVWLWVMYKVGAPAGYFELERHDDGSVEVAYFGLLPDFIGQGLGKHLLTRAVEEAWMLGPNRVWLHTCTLDHPSAMSNYLKRGFKPFRSESYQVTVDER